MKNLKRANDWFQRARSNMARAKVGKFLLNYLREEM